MAESKRSRAGFNAGGVVGGNLHHRVDGQSVIARGSSGQRNGPPRELS